MRDSANSNGVKEYRGAAPSILESFDRLGTFEHAGSVMNNLSRYKSMVLQMMFTNISPRYGGHSLRALRFMEMLETCKGAKGKRAGRRNLAT